MQTIAPSVLIHLLDSQPFGMGVYNARGQCLYCNQYAYSAFQLTEAAFKSITIFNLFPEQTELTSRFNQLIQHALATWAFEVNQNGRWFHVTLSADQEDHVFATVRETTEQQQLKQQLIESQQNVKRLDDAINGANIGCWDFFPKEGKIIANKTWVTQKKYEDAELRKDNALFSEVINGLQKWSEIVHPDDLAPTMEIIQQHLDGKTEVYDAKFRMRCGDGQWRWIHDRGRVFERDADGTPHRMNGVHIDITASKQLESRILDLLNTDYLTNVSSRRTFEQHLDRVLSQSKRDNSYLAFLLLDIDHFKLFNDTYGHLEGDQSLTAIGSVINQSLRRGEDTCFRLGGEEFAIIYQVDHKATALTFAQTIKARIEALEIPHRHNTASPYVTVSMGLWCEKVSQDIAADDMYNFADALLYQAKAAGRNTIKAS